MAGRPEERRTDPTNHPNSKKTFTFQEFIEFYGNGHGHQMWKQGRRLGGDAGEEKRRDPTNPPHVKNAYTNKQFIEFYGPSYGRTMWRKAGKDESPCPELSTILSRRKNSKLDNAQGVSWSFEFFPPRTDDGVKNLDARLGRMRGMHPEFVDFTWGAGGSTSDLTVDLCKMAQNKHHYIANMHLTCTNMEKGKVEEALKACKQHHIRNIVALRGDPPAGQTEWKATDTGFTCALDLIKYIREETGDHFCLSISGYPEGHPDKIPDYAEYLKTGKIPEDVAKAEMDYLKAKVEAGGNVIITQMFYDADTFIEWEKECRKAGIPKSVKIIPGVLPIQNYGGFRKMIGFCKTFISADLEKEVEENKPKDGLEGDAKKEAEDKFKAFGVRQMTMMCQKLIANGCKHIHFYTLNLDKSTTQILKNLGFVPWDYSEETAPAYSEQAQQHPAYLNLPEPKEEKKEEKKEEEKKEEEKKENGEKQQLHRTVFCCAPVACLHQTQRQTLCLFSRCPTDARTNICVWMRLRSCKLGGCAPGSESLIRPKLCAIPFLTIVHTTVCPSYACLCNKGWRSTLILHPFCPIPIFVSFPNPHHCTVSGRRCV